MSDDLLVVNEHGYIWRPIFSIQIIIEDLRVALGTGLCLLLLYNTLTTAVVLSPSTSIGSVGMRSVTDASKWSNP